MIYFIKQQASLAIRIGIAANVEDRIQQLQAGSSRKLIHLKSIYTENDYTSKHLLHTRLKKIRLNQSHWFIITPAVKNFLDKLEHNKFYHTSKIKYLLSTAERSVNKFKIKINNTKIREKMNIAGFNQSYLAKKMKSSRATVSLALIKQQTSLFTIQKMAYALKCNPEELIAE